jgi:N-acetylmuramoyl-L-alanine amidase
LAVALAAFLACGACGGKHDTAAGTSSGASSGQLDAVERARATVGASRPPSERPGTLAVAESVEALAVREGAGARAVELHALAARVLERVWRGEGREQDAKEAIDLYRAASHDVAVPGACDAAVRAAKLSGELARDASATYAELYRVERRVAGAQADGGVGDSSCSREIDRALTMLAAFRPPARVLESIDQGLLGEGALAAAVASADATGRVSDVPQISRIEHWPGKESARVVLVLTRPARFRAGDFVTPPVSAGRPSNLRMYVDLDGVDPGAAPHDARTTGIVTRVQTGTTTTGARVTLELDGQAFRRIFYLPEPYRVVIDIARHPPGATVGRGRRSVERVVLDPGHGGSDPGAIGPAGVREKDVTLDIARRAAPILVKEGLEVILTRTDDRFVTLEERTARANEQQADLFVSIHCNAAENHVRHGIETYVLDTTKDEIAARVAARENATSQAATAELGSILANMRMADQASRSTRLAELMQRAALGSLRDKYPDVHDGGVHTAGFYVLVGARMPSILFETSYVSNPSEEQRLGSEDYRERMADAIVNAVKAYREGR